MYYTDNPVDDFNRWDAEQNRKLERLPICADCENHIQDEEAYYRKGKWICECCMDACKREVMPE